MKKVLEPEGTAGKGTKVLMGGSGICTEEGKRWEEEEEV